MNEPEREIIKNSDEQQKAVRQYLLGSLNDKVEMRRIEEKILLDDGFAESLSLAEDQLIDEYLDGSLTESEREQFHQFFLISHENKEKLQLIRNLRKYAAHSSDEMPTAVKFAEKQPHRFDWRKLFTSPALRFAVILLAIFGLGFGIWRAAFYQTDIDRGLAQLQTAYRGQRPTESRTTAKFDYAPLSSTRGAADSAADETAQRLAEMYLLQAKQTSPTAEAHQALGLLYLAEKDYDNALPEFDQAVKLAPGSAELQNDFGAALLEKAKQAELNEKFDEALENYSLALTSINRALELDPSLQEAYFNKALILQKMKLNNQAQQAWNKYLEKDSVSRWADEARRNLKRLEVQNDAPKDKSQVLQDFIESYRVKNDARAWEIISQTKELITGVMIEPQLAHNYLKADQQSRKEEADELLSAFVYLGELEKRNARDFYFAELAEYYLKTNSSQRQKLLTAHNELQNGHEQIKKGNFAQALTALRFAEENFSSVGNLWEAKLVEHRIAYCLSRLDKISESNELLLQLAEFCERANYKWLQGLADGWIGSNYSLLGEHTKAVIFNRKSLKTAETISDNYNVQKALNQLTNEYWLIGDKEKTLNSIYRSLAVSNSYFQSLRQKDRNILFATEGLFRFKFYDAAAVFGQEEIHVAQNELKDKWLTLTARNHLAVIYGEAQKYQAAFQEIDAGFQLSNAFEEESMRRKQTAYTRLIQAHIQRESGSCEDAIDNYNQVIQEYENTEFSINNYEARKGRLLCYVAKNDDSAVKEEMPAVIKLFDENRRTIAEETDRNIFFDREQSVYDIAVDYAFARLQEKEQAFDYAENSRARSLLGLLKHDSAQPISLSDLRQKIPPGTQIIYYAVLADKILIWYISGEKQIAAEKLIKITELNDKIENYRKLINRRSNSREAAQELYELLIKPIEATLDSKKSLSIIPDKILFQVPFAALQAPDTNKYLIENYSILYAPSATIFVGANEIAGKKTAISQESILSVGNPTFSRAEYPELDDLPDASAEALKIAEFYSTAKVFTGKNAAKEIVINNWREADVFHFAGHYVPHAKSPTLSKLLLASDDLTVEELASKNQPRSRLVVLSACETGTESFYNGEGMIGAARGFLASAVPLVVASQWAVDSEATAELMIKFHQFRKLQNFSTTAALRQAQIAMLHDENELFRQPFYWAAFLSVGGYAEY